MKLYNTLSRKLEAVTPNANNRVSLYTCGLTVYSQPHIGNWVAYIYWDILVRTLRDTGYDVTRVQNITDVGHLTSDEDAGEDKMLKGALSEGLNAWQVAEKYIAIADDEAYNQLNLLRPEHMPRATDYIPQQIAFVTELEKQGFTYVIDDGVYFDTSKLSDYGKLARLDIDGLQFGARVADTGKKNPTDFAVWKFSNPNEKRDMEWESPWGVGFPGWHLECSVMAKELLGEQIDIHTGGIDHIPVHHTNEIAQTEAVTGKPFSKLWLHANHIKVNGTKISKSLGNGFTLSDIQAKGYSLEAFKVMVLSKHYRTEGNFTWDILDAAQSRMRGYQAVADQQWQGVHNGGVLDTAIMGYKERIQEALRNDLGTPEALALLSELESDIATSGISARSIGTYRDFLLWVDSVLGLSLSQRADLSEEQKIMLAERREARTANDWTIADKLRDALAAEGIGVNDAPYGQTWYRQS